MKNMFVGLLIACLSTGMLLAQTITVDGINYNITYSGEPSAVEVTYGTYDGDIVIHGGFEYEGNDYYVQGIGHNAFEGSYINSIEIPNSVTYIGDQAFASSTINSIEIPNSVMHIGGNAFAYSYINSIEIPNSVVFIGPSAFEGSSLVGILIPNSVEYIGDYAFANSDLGGIDIPNSVEYIGDHAFFDCSHLGHIEVDPENDFYSSIDGVLYNKEITTLIQFPPMRIYANIPESVTTIEYNAFHLCGELTSLTSHAIIPPNAHYGEFYGVTQTIPIHVPSQSVDEYKGASGWSYFYNIIGMDKVFEMKVNPSPDGYTKVNEGQPVYLPVTVSELTTVDNIIAYQFDIEFDNSVLEYTGNDIAGTIAQGGTVEVNTSIDGKLSISYMNSTAIVGTGDILKLNFNTLKIDTTYVLISNAYLNATEVTDLTAGTVIIDDVTPPTFTAPDDITIYSDASCNYDASIAVTGDVEDEADNYAVGEATYSDAIDDSNPCAVIITRTWSLVDDFGNAAPNQVQTITVEDNIPPTFTAPADITIQSDASCNYDASVSNTGDVTDEADNCGVGEATYSDAIDDSNPCAVIITRTWSLSDNCGNAAADQVQTITVEDVTPPTAAITYSHDNIRHAHELLITSTFSEPMNADNAVMISLSGAASLENAEMTRVSETLYTYTYTIPKTDGEVTVSMSNGTDLWGNEVVSEPTSGGSFTIIGIRYGDVDGNNHIQAYDAALTLQYSVGLDPMPSVDPLPWETWRIETANVDGVGGVTANDASLILKYSARIIDIFPVEDNTKSAKSTTADVSITYENDELIFTSTGNLYGLNIFVENDFNLLGQPMVYASNIMQSSNITDTNYAFGLATAYAPEEGKTFLKIPFTSDEPASITFDMIVNSEQKTVTVDIISTGIENIRGNYFIIYPNPVQDELNINGVEVNSTISIYNLGGKLMLSTIATSTNPSIDVSELQNGIHVIIINEGSAQRVSKFVKQ